MKEFRHKVETARPGDVCGVSQLMDMTSCLSFAALCVYRDPVSAN